MSLTFQKQQLSYDIVTLIEFVFNVIVVIS